MTEEECPEFAHQLPRDSSMTYSIAKAQGFKGSLQDWWDSNTRYNKSYGASIKNSFLAKGRGVKQTLQAKNIRSSIPLASQHALLDGDVNYRTALTLGYEHCSEAWETFKFQFNKTLSR